MSIFLVHRTKTHSVKYKLSYFDMEETIKSLKERFTNNVESPECIIDFVYRGAILRDEQTLTQTGIKPDVVIHILTKPIPKQAPAPHVVSEELIIQVHKFIVAINSHPHHKIAFMKINRKESFEKIMKKNPALNNDPKAKTMLLDPFLITTLTDIKALRSIAQDHPALIEAFRSIIEVLKEAKTSSSSQTPSTSLGLSFSMLESMMFETDSESSGSEYIAPGPSTSRTQNTRAITTNQLSDAIALANRGSIPRASSSSSINNPSSSSLITSSMFSNALSQAMNQVRPSRNRLVNRRTASEASGSSSQSQSQSQNRNNYMAPLQMMRTMGLTEDALNIHALEICNGDVQAAINLILSGAISNE